MVTNPRTTVTLHQLEVFLAAAHSATFREAGLQLGLAPPTVSQHLRALERALAVRLIQRSPGRREIRLTAAGELLAKSCETALPALDEAFRGLGGSGGDHRPAVRLGCGIAFSAGALPAFYSVLQAAHTEIDLKVTISQRANLVHDLHQERLDLAVLLEAADDAQLEQQRLGLSTDIVLVGRSGAARQGNGRLTLAQLTHETLLLPPRGTMHRTLLEQRAAELGVELHGASEINLPDARIQAVLAGLGIAAVGYDFVAATVGRGDLVVLDVQGFPIHSEWYLAWRAGHLSDDASLVRDYLLPRGSDRRA